MRVLYPFNEVLPGKKAHDLYVYNHCASLADAGLDVRLLVGLGSPPADELARFHGWEKDTGLKVVRRPLWRRNTWMRTSWNFPFNLITRIHIARTRPDVVFCCLPKQARLLFAWKRRKTRYVYDVHALHHYPGAPGDAKRVERERRMLDKADLVIVTTEALRRILLEEPYALKTPVEVVPLAVRVKALEGLPPKTDKGGPPTLMYIGNLDAGQGVRRLLAALPKDVRLELVGGKPAEVDAMRREAEARGVADRVRFHGHSTPREVNELAAGADAFAVPMDGSGRNPYTARTKVLEYLLWNRPVVLPDLPAMREHVPEEKGVLFFAADDGADLRRALTEIADPVRRGALQQEVGAWAGRFSWAARAKRMRAVLADLTSSGPA